MSKESQPAKYQEVFGEKPNSDMPIANRSVRKAFQEIKDPHHSEAARRRIERNAYLSRWGIDMEDEEKPPSEEEKFRSIVNARVISPREDAIRKTAIYRNLMQHIKNAEKQSKAEKDGINVTLPQSGEIFATRKFTEGTIPIAGRLQAELVDTGHQSVINTVHKQEGIILVYQEGGE